MLLVGAIAVVSAYPYPYPQAPGGALAIPRPGPDGSYAKDHYFQYTNVPAEKVFEWGYRRGNDPAHFREEYLSQKDHTFKAKVLKSNDRPTSKIVIGRFTVTSTSCNTSLDIAIFKINKSFSSVSFLGG